MMVYQCFDKKTSGGAATLARSETLATRSKFAIKNENISKKEIAEELHKLIIRKFGKRKVHLTFYRQHLPYRSRRYAIDK